MQFFGMLQLSDLEKIGLSLKQVYYYIYNHNKFKLKIYFSSKNMNKILTYTIFLQAHNLFTKAAKKLFDDKAEDSMLN